MNGTIFRGASERGMTMANEIHRSKWGTYHPAPCDSQEHLPANGLWTIHDTRGMIDGGPACDECGKCECGICEGCQAIPPCDACKCQCEEDDATHNEECIGLSFAYVCLDGGEVLCEECAHKAGISITDCDCA